MKTIHCESLVFAALAVCGVTVCSAAEKNVTNKANDVLEITSIPEGAQVEWNRKVIGVTPLAYRVGEYAFNAKKASIFSKHLAAPVTIRLSKDGYIAKEVVITGPPMLWISLNRQNSYQYWVIPSNHLNIDLDKISAKPAALTNEDVIRLRLAGFSDELIIDKINSSPAAFNLEFDDLIALRQTGISDQVIQAMMHAK